MKESPQINRSKNKDRQPPTADHQPPTPVYALRPTSYALLPFWLGVFLFSVYLLSFSGKFHVMDELAVFTAGHNLAQHGRADINQLIWTNHWTPNPPGIWGQDGHLYTKKAPGISVIAAPLIWLGHTIPGLNAVHLGLLTNTIVTALTASLLFIWLVDLGFSRWTATLTTLGYGLGTIAWVYARMFWESSLLALVFLLAMWAAYRATSPAYAPGRWGWLLLCGIAMAIGLTLRFETIPAIAFTGLYLLWESANGRMANRRTPPKARDTQHATRNTQHATRNTFHSSFIIYLIPSLLTGLALLYFNFVRYGSFSETGYTQEILFRAPWAGGFGLLLSPGRGLFIYAPLLLLLFFGIRPAWRRLPRPYFWLIAAMCLFYWLFYGAWFAWGGTWGWGPRFLLPILPLLMLFVAEPLEWANSEWRMANGRTNRASVANTLPGTGERMVTRNTQHATRNTHPQSSITCLLAWLGIGLLATLSLIVNLLGIAVDFNEHFLRLGSNDNFVFNWAAFPPLAHWHILQEGLIDIIWLRQQPAGLMVEWPVLRPALMLFALATVGLIMVIRGQELGVRGQGLGALLALFLTYQMMMATAEVGRLDEQAQTDWPVLETLTATARPGDSLLVAMPPFGDVQEITVRLMAYLDPPLPTFAWIESEPRAIQPAERERVWQAAQARTRRVWLFERWLTQSDPMSVTAAGLNQEAFPIQEQWFARSGKLTLYALAAEAESPPPTPLNIPFQGGLTLVDFRIVDAPFPPGETLKLRLTWQAATGDELAAQGVPVEAITVFTQLLNQATPAQPVAQYDRLLVDWQHVEQSPLLPGQTISQGYGLLLPDDLLPGDYPLVVGLYQATTGQRLRRTDGSPDDFLYLANIIVK